MIVSENDIAKLQSLYAKHFGYKPSKTEATAAAEKLLLAVASASDEFIKDADAENTYSADKLKNGV
jgi:hypothetical protein